jgi:hypothetical protein
VTGECFGRKLIGCGILVNPPVRSDWRERERERERERGRRERKKIKQ